MNLFFTVLSWVSVVWLGFSIWVLCIAMPDILKERKDARHEAKRVAQWDAIKAQCRERARILSVPKWIRYPGISSPCFRREDFGFAYDPGIKAYEILSDGTELFHGWTGKELAEVMCRPEEFVET